MFGFKLTFRDPDPPKGPDITQYNLMVLHTIGKLSDRIAVLEAELALRQSKEAEASRIERQKSLHGIG